MDAGLPPRLNYPSHRIIELRNRPTVIFVTVRTRSRRPLLANPDVHAMLCDVWASAGAWVVGRYVIMPDHVHLFAAPGTPELPLTNWISFWKRAFTRRHSQAIWQNDYWDTTLRNAAHAADRWEYIHQNPVRAGLVNDPDAWPWQGEMNTLGWP